VPCSALLQGARKRAAAQASGLEWSVQATPRPGDSTFICGMCKKVPHPCKYETARNKCKKIEQTAKDVENRRGVIDAFRGKGGTIQLTFRPIIL
jgi:hypothetical protein